MDSEYIISGTLPEISKILNESFSLSDEESSFFTTVLTYNRARGNPLKQEEAITWYLEKNKVPYTTSMFNTRYSICLTDFKKDVLTKLILHGGAALLSGEASWGIFILDVIVSLTERFVRIEDNMLCVYFLALELKKTHKPINASNLIELLREKMQNEVCVKLDKNLACPHCHGDICNIGVSVVESILIDLCKNNVMEKIGDYYEFKR